MKLAGLLTAVTVPTGFWTGAIWLGGKSLNIAIDAPELVALCFVVASLSLIVAAVTMSAHGRDD